MTSGDLMSFVIPARHCLYTEMYIKPVAASVNVSSGTSRLHHIILKDHTAETSAWFSHIPVKVTRKTSPSNSINCELVYFGYLISMTTMNIEYFCY